MKVLYCRVSSLTQNLDRQKVDEKSYKLVIEDKCSGAVPFFDRQGGKEILSLIDNNALSTLAVVSIDRLGRDLRDIMNTIHYFTKRSIAINFISQGLSTLDENGNENPISKMMIGIFGTLSEMEKAQIRERQLEGIKIAKLKGVYKGRAEGSKEDILAFLSKPKNKEALSYLKKGYKAVEISKLTNLHINTITKIKKLGLNQQQMVG